MLPAWLSALPHAEPTTLSVCMSLPGYLLAAGRQEVACEALTAIAGHSRDGFVLERITAGARGGGEGDFCSTLWFARAAYLFRRSCSDVPTWTERLLPTIKKAAQTVISGKTAALRMDDGGLLAPTATEASPAGPGSEVCPMGENALWYFMLSMLAEELHALNDPAGDHFDRLAGRFRRSFFKTFWCPIHGFLCDPQLQKAPDHAAAHAVPDPSQLLIATLPFSPIPRTKQRQIVLAVREKALDLLPAPARGVIMPKSSREGGLRHSQAPENTASSLHLAWLVEALLVTADAAERAAAECKMLLPPPGPVARFYVDGLPASIPENRNPHAASTAETQRVRKLCGCC